MPLYRGNPSLHFIDARDGIFPKLVKRRCHLSLWRFPHLSSNFEHTSATRKTPAFANMAHISTRNRPTTPPRHSKWHHTALPTQLDSLKSAATPRHKRKTWLPKIPLHQGLPKTTIMKHTLQQHPRLSQASSAYHSSSACKSSNLRLTKAHARQ